MLSVTEAANYAQVSRKSVLVAIKEGRLKAKRVGHFWLVEKADLRQYMARMGIRNGWQKRLESGTP